MPGDGPPGHIDSSPLPIRIGVEALAATLSALSVGMSHDVMLRLVKFV